MKDEMGKKRKILHIIHGFGSGGVETWMLACVKYLNAHPEYNLQFDFLITGGLPAIFDEEIKRNGSEIFYKRYSFNSILKFRKEFRRILKINQYCAVHDHQDFITGWHYLLGGNLLPAIRIVQLHNPYNFVHNYVVNPLRWVSFKMGRKLMAKEVTAITGTSDAVMDEYGYDKGVYIKKRTYPAYCGFDTNKFIYINEAKRKLCEELNWKESIKIALFVGRIGLQSVDTAANQKNPEFAFAIAKGLIINHSEWNFLFIGYKGETGEQMEKETEAMKLNGRIRFLDIRHDIPQIMSASDILIFPSLWEGLGMVSVEAQCTGLKVVMSNTVPDEAIVCPELVTVKKLESGINEWINTIVNIYPTQINREEYSAKIRNSHFSIENSVKRLIDLYGC